MKPETIELKPESRNGHKPTVPPLRNWLRRLTPADIEPLNALALADNTSVMVPSHVFLKRGELVGYASVATMPFVLAWFDTKRCQARDSIYYIQSLEMLMTNILPPEHQRVCVVPFCKPFAPFMQKLGFEDAGQFNLGFKKL